MLRTLLIGLIGMLVGFAWCAPARASEHEGGAPPRKDGILLVAFGTTVPSGAKAYEGIEAKVRAAFPGAEIRWALTSKTVRKKLAERGTPADSPEVALGRLLETGVTHLAVLSLHVSAGQEYYDLVQSVQVFKEMPESFQKVKIAFPLLASHEDLERVAKAMLGHLPAKPEGSTGVLFMGHGNPHHPGDTIYTAMAYVLQNLNSRAFIATVEGRPNLDDAIPAIQKQGVKKLYMVPLLTVAGVHVRDDMAGDEPDSWKSRLAKKGISSEPVLKGIAEYPDVVDVWVDHLKTAYKEL